MPSAGLTDYPRGVEWLDAVRGGQSVRACWLVDPSWRWDATGPDDWTRGVAQAVVSVLTSGRGAIVVVPDGRDLDRCRTALEATLGVGTVAILRGELGPSARYRNYLSLSRGQCQVALGTRSAVFAPVRHLGLIVVVDDGDDLLAEPRAPYPHARDVAALRAVQEGAALLLASPARSCEAQQWIRRGWMVPIANPRSTARRRAPLVRVAADWDAALARDPLARATRLPHDALETIRTGLGAGPVLVQVPRAGYVVALACARCRTPVRCAACHGPVQVRQPGRVLACGWCGRVIADWACPECGGHELRAPRIGSTRTAEELGRAFPGYRLIDSAADHVVATVGSQPALVVCTPGAEPIPEAGYAAAVLLDTAVLLHRDDLRAAEEALRRWLAAVVLVRPGGDGGTVCVVGETSERAIQALVRVDPDGFATRELADRAAAGFPPAVRFVRVDGEPAPLRDLLDAIVLPDGAEVLGPVDLPPSGPERAPAQQRAVLRATLARSAALTDAVKAAMALRSARKADGVVRVQVDPAAIG
jgi:primosomal protein N' (replication factor Y)